MFEHNLVYVLQHLPMLIVLLAPFGMFGGAMDRQTSPTRLASVTRYQTVPANRRSVGTQVKTI